MIVESSDQVPRCALLKRFPVPRNLGVGPESRITRGKSWPAPAGAVRVKSFEIYRYAPDSGVNPRLDTFEVDLDDCGPMALDALFWIKNKLAPAPSGLGYRPRIRTTVNLHFRVGGHGGERRAHRCGLGRERVAGRVGCGSPEHPKHAYALGSRD